VINKEARSASVIARTDVVLWELHNRKFEVLVDEKIRRMLRRKIEIQDEQVTLNELEPIKVLGKGLFGVVFLCTKHSDTNKLFALKCIHRRKIEKMGAYDMLINERKILSQIDHIMVLKMIKTYKDEDHVYFLTEYIRGVDLFETIRNIGVLSDIDAKFYIGCLILAIEHL
jgi:cGMP-dependent protein kinase